MNSQEDLKKDVVEKDVVELPPINSPQSIQGDTLPFSTSPTKNAQASIIQQDGDATVDQNKALLDDHSHLIIDNDKEEANMVEAKSKVHDQGSSDQTQIAPAPINSASMMKPLADKSAYHPQMVDRFTHDAHQGPQFFGSRNVKHEFSDEDSNDPDMDPVQEEEQSQYGFLNKIGVSKEHAQILPEEKQEKQELEGPKSYAKFKNYKSVFDNLTKHNVVPTAFDIVSMIITYDSSHTVAVTKKDDGEYYIRMFQLETYEQTFSEKVGGEPDSYIKMKDIEQNQSGSKFALAYIDDGNFKIRIFGKENRDQAEIDKTQLNINEKIGINNFTMPIPNFPEPYITCTFVSDDLLFVNLFYNHTQVHYHFLYHIPSMKISNLFSKKLDCTRLNFPYKCFFDTNLHQVYSFYRQGQSIRLPINRENHETEEEAQFEQVIDKDLGQMFLINNKALVARSSGKIFFFKREKDEDTDVSTWQLYETLNHKGLIFYIKGNVRIQVTTDEKIYFYMIDQKTFQPTLEAVMYNFMKCNQMMFGSKVRYCITYKTNQRSFEVYRRQYEHNFKNLVHKANFEGSKGLTVKKTNRILVTDINRIHVINSENYKEMPDEEIVVELLVDNTAREPNQILSIAQSDDEFHLALITGKQLIKNQQTPNQLFVYKLDSDGKYQFVKRQVLKDHPELVGICMQFHFKINTSGGHTHSLFFAQKDKIIEYDFETAKVTLVYDLDPPLRMQPNFFVMNDDQNCCIISNSQDSVFLNIKNKRYEDIDKLYQISSMKQIVYDQEFQCFFIMANKYREKLGLFIIKLEEEQPENFKFLLKIKNKLDIGDADIEVHKCKEKGYKELIISYKTIYMNTYNVTVIDITNPKKFKTIFRHESFQLWESPIKGFLVDQSKDYVTLNSNGLSHLALGNTDKRVFTGNQTQEMVTHSLEQLNYLKVDNENLIEWDATEETNKLVYVKQLVDIEIDGDTEQYFDKVYNINLHKITLRELLFFQSIEKCSTQSQILDLVNEQPTPTIFLKSFFELNGGNMTAILSFDSKSIHSIIGEHNDQYFTDEYPIFYRNKIAKKNNPKKFFYRSAIDTAMKNNQVQAVHYMIDYIIRFQNNFTSSWLFNRNFTKLQQKGISVAELLASDVFIYKFDYELWPQNHTDAEDYIRPYNGSIFDLRNAYSEIFFEKRFEKIKDDEDSSKVFKVNYSINMLPQIGIHHATCPETQQLTLVQPELQIMNLFTETEELDVYRTTSLQQLIQWKWQSFATHFMLFGLFMHLIQVITIIFYITEIYMHSETENLGTYRIVLAFGMVVPLSYDLVQLWHSGPIAYFSSVKNIINFTYILSCLTNWIMICTPKYSKPDLPVMFENQVLMILTILCSIPKTFFMLRVFGGLSYIVTMLVNVISDLRVFLFFYGILIFMFSQFLTILGLGNCRINTTLIPENANGSGFMQDYGVETTVKGKTVYGPECNWDKDGVPGVEYKYLGMFLGNIIQTFRMSLGDFDFDASQSLLPHINIIFWFIWLLIVVITNIIFLNFIIAEASASYETVKERLDEMILKERADLINEGEDMTSNWLKKKDLFPKYIIIRTIDK